MAGKTEDREMKDCGRWCMSIVYNQTEVRQESQGFKAVLEVVVGGGDQAGRRNY